MYGKIYRNLLHPFFERVIKRRRTLEYWAEAELSQWWSRHRLQQHQLQSLKRLLQHAYATCPYYRKRWDAAGVDPKRLVSIEQFEEFPLLTRKAIRRDRGEICSSEAYRRIRKSTGGSSGEPLHFELDGESHERRTAMMYRGYGWAGGAPGTKQLFIWGSHVGQASALKRFKQALHRRFDRQKLISCFEFTPEKMGHHAETLAKYRPDVIVAYTNPFYEFAKYLSETGVTPFSPRSIIVGAEKLHGFQRQLIESLFQAPVFETYGTREFMLIGAECERHAGLHLSMENLLVEVVDDDGRPAPPGNEGNVVVTDLFNYAMPFIRYVNGDRAVAGFEMCDCGRGLPLLKQVVGRRLDVLETPDGRKIPGEFFPHLLKEFGGVRRFQVIQTTDWTITLKLVVGEEFSESDRFTLLSEIHQCVGSEVEIDLQLVDDIPLTAAGKRQVVLRHSDEPLEKNVSAAGARH